MSILSFNISLIHIFFLLIFLNYFLREVALEGIDKILKNDKNDGKFTFGNSPKATRKLFNMYIYTLSNLFSFVCIIIINKRTRRFSLKSSETLDKSLSSNTLEYIYTDDLPINKTKLLTRTFILTICDFIAQCIVFLIFLIVNDDSKLDLHERLDTLCIFNILSKYLFSKIILQTKYYKHHYISFGINIFCLILLGSIEITQNKITRPLVIFIFIRISSQIIYSLEDVVGKRALIEEFLSPYSLLAYKGVYELVILLIFTIPFFFIKRDGKIIFSLMGVFLNKFERILLFFIIMILNFTYNILIWIIIDRFSPNDYAMAMVIEGITDLIILLIYDRNEIKTWLYILRTIIYFILIFGTCIHSEIIIINKYGLNENTKKRFAQIGDEDYQLAKSVARDSANSFDNDDDEKIEKKRSGSKELKKVGTLKKINIPKSRAKTISPFNLQNMENFEDDDNVPDE